MNLILDGKEDSVFSFLSPLGQRTMGRTGNERNRTRKKVKDCAIHHQFGGMDFVYNWCRTGKRRIWQEEVDENNHRTCDLRTI